MIPNLAGAAVAGMLVMGISLLIGLGLMSWWLWRLVHAAQGKPRPAMAWWQWILAVTLSIVPISMAVSLGSFWLRDQISQREEHANEKWRYQTLQQAQQWGDVLLPVGTHIEREPPPPWQVVDTSLPPDHADGTLDLRYLRAARFPYPVSLAGMQVRALTVYPPTVELDQPYPEGEAECVAGATASFASKDADTHASMYGIDAPQALFWKDWQFDQCFLGDPIRVLYWQGDTLVWTDVKASQ